MQSEENTVKETSTQTKTQSVGSLKSAFNIGESDYVGRFVFYVFIAIVVLGFASMVGMGIFAFYFGV